jgi:hypothetical protein
MESRKPTFRDLRDRHHFSISQVKGLTDLPELVIYHMLVRVPVDKTLAARVLEQISAITKVEYTLENVFVALSQDVQSEKDIAQESLLPTFQEVRKQHHITINMLIEDTQLPPQDVLLVDAQGIGMACTIDLLLEALSRMSERSYTRRNVRGFYFISPGEEMGQVKKRREINVDTR